MKFTKRALLVTYFSGDTRYVDTKEHSIGVIRVEPGVYDRVLRRLRRKGSSFGDDDVCHTDRGDEYQVLYSGAVVTVINPRRKKETRGLEIEAVDANTIDRVVELLKLNKDLRRKN
jgi:hypothetical protein